MLTVEGATFVEDGIAPLAHAYEQGVRSVQLVHYIENPLGDFQTEAPQHDGLTELGREVIAGVQSPRHPRRPRPLHRQGDAPSAGSFDRSR